MGQKHVEITFSQPPEEDDQLPDIDVLLSELEDKVTFDKEGNPSYPIVDKAKEKLSQTIALATVAFLEWDPKKESAAHAAAQVGLSKSTFLQWAQKLKTDKNGRKDLRPFLVDLAKLSAQAHGLTAPVWAITQAVKQVHLGLTKLDEIPPIEQECVRRICARYDIKMPKDQKPTIFDDARDD